MEYVRRAPGPAAQVDILQDREHLQGGEPLAVGWELEQLVAAVADTARRHPLPAMFGQVAVFKAPRHGLEVACHGPGQRAAVEGVAPLQGDGFQGVRQVGIGDDLPGAGRPAFREPGVADVLEVGAVAQDALESRPVALQVVGDYR